MSDDNRPKIRKIKCHHTQAIGLDYVFSSAISVGEVTGIRDTTHYQYMYDRVDVSTAVGVAR